MDEVFPCSEPMWQVGSIGEWRRRDGQRKAEGRVSSRPPLTRYYNSGCSFRQPSRTRYVAISRRATGGSGPILPAFRFVGRTTVGLIASLNLNIDAGVRTQEPIWTTRIEGAAAGSVATRDLVRDEVVLSAQTWVVKVGTSVLAGPRRAARPGASRPPGRADQHGDGHRPPGRPGQFRGRRGGDRPARPEAASRQPPPAPGRRRRRPVVPDPGLRRGPPPATADTPPSSC